MTAVVAARLGLADRLRCRLADLDAMPVAEFNLILAGYAERAADPFDME